MYVGIIIPKGLRLVTPDSHAGWSELQNALSESLTIVIENSI